MFYSVSDGDDINKNRRMGVVITPLSLQIGRSVRPVTEQRFIPIQGIALNRNDITLEIGQEYKLKASFIPSDATRKRIFWYSGNSAVAKVDAHGKVTAISNGECTIKAVCGDFKAECQVTVRMPKGYTPSKQEEAVVCELKEIDRRFVNGDADGIGEIRKSAEANTELSNWNKLRIINECNLALIDLRIENTGTLKNAEA